MALPDMNVATFLFLVDLDLWHEDRYITDTAAAWQQYAINCTSHHFCVRTIDERNSLFHLISSFVLYGVTGIVERDCDD